MTVPVYELPESPILIVGFCGILFTLVLLYFVNRDYFNSPLNRDRKWPQKQKTKHLDWTTKESSTSKLKEKNLESMTMETDYIVS